MHREIEPAIHYWGTPVVLVSTRNEDGTANVAPMSSAWWLGWSCMLGFDASSKTVENLRRERECVLNLASVDNVEAVNRLARTTGTRRPPLHKKMLGYRHVHDKTGHASLTVEPARVVSAVRVTECPVQLEAEVVAILPFGTRDPKMSVPACSVEVEIRAAHVEEAILEAPDRIDPERWRPLVMSFRRLFSLGQEVDHSRLNRGEESLYAPWKQRGLRRVAAAAVGAHAKRRYRVDDPASPEVGNDP